MITRIVTYISRHQVACAFGAMTAKRGSSDMHEHRAVVAGLLAASRELLTPAEFSRLVSDCEIDPTEIEDLLAFAVADPSDTTDPSDNTIEV